MNQTDNRYKYFAFISYNSNDTEWGKRLQRKLEHYKMPATLCSEHGWKRNPINPVFFAPYEIQPQELDEELKERLRASKNLIVICSPNSAQSEWVGKEISYFHSLGRAKNIYFFIIEGTPNTNNNQECYNPVIKKLGMSGYLGVNIHEPVFRWSYLNKERAYVQLITKLLGVEFDTIWQRHKRLLFKQWSIRVIGTIAVIAVLFCVWKTNQPVDVGIKLNESSVNNPYLPPLENAIISLTIDKETKVDTIKSITEAALFANIPNSAIGKEAHIIVSCINWQPIDTVILLNKEQTIPISRDPYRYGSILFRLYNKEKLGYFSNEAVTVNGRNITSDSLGYFSFLMPLEEQRMAYVVTSRLIIENDTLKMPNTSHTVLIAHEP